MQALGAYLGELRSARGWSGKDVVTAITRQFPELDPPNPNYISRIERGKIPSPGLRLIAALTVVLEGDADRVIALVLGTDEERANDRLRTLMTTMGGRQALIDAAHRLDESA